MRLPVAPGSAPWPWLARIAVAALLASGAACAREAKPVRKPAVSPAPEPARPAAVPPAFLLGQLCPTLGAGRPAVVPLAVRRERWRGGADEPARLVASRWARQFSVMAWDGRRAGILSVAGSATAHGRSVAIGSFAGASPCTGEDGQTVAACMRATAGCGLALATLEPPGGLKARPFEEDPDPKPIRSARACLDADELSLDVDGDGKSEVFERTAFAPLDGNLPEVLVTKSSAPRSCTGRFAIADLRPGVSLIGAGDFDQDGRVELVLSYRRGSDEMWGLYRARQTPARLERVVQADVVRPSLHE